MTIPGSGDPHTDQFSIRRAREEVGSKLAAPILERAEENTGVWFGNTLMSHTFRAVRKPHREPSSQSSKSEPEVRIHLSPPGSPPKPWQSLKPDDGADAARTSSSTARGQRSKRRAR